MHSTYRYAFGEQRKSAKFLRLSNSGEKMRCHVSNLVKKCLSNRCPQFFMQYFNYNTEDVMPRRTKNNIKQTTVYKVRMYEKGLYYHCRVIFNQI